MSVHTFPGPDRIGKRRNVGGASASPAVSRRKSSAPYADPAGDPDGLARLIASGGSQFAKARGDALDEVMAAHFILRHTFYLFASLTDCACALDVAAAASTTWARVHPEDGPDAS